MIQKILPMLNKLIPIDLAKKGLSKIDPRIGKFLANATAAGYPINEAMDYLREQTNQVDDRGLRTDELAAQKRVQQGNAVGSAVKGASLGIGGAAALPTVIGSLFQDKSQPQNATQALLQTQAKMKNKRQRSELSREALQEQAQQSQRPDDNVDDALLAALDKILKM